MKKIKFLVILKFRYSANFRIRHCSRWPENALFAFLGKMQFPLFWACIGADARSGGVFLHAQFGPRLSFSWRGGFVPRAIWPTVLKVRFGLINPDWQTWMNTMEDDTGGGIHPGIHRARELANRGQRTSALTAMMAMNSRTMCLNGSSDSPGVIGSLGS